MVSRQYRIVEKIMAVSGETRPPSGARPIKRIRLVAFVVAPTLFFLSFVSGVAIAAWQLPPYQALKTIWDSRPWGDLSLEASADEIANGFDWEADIVESAFSTNPSIDGELYYPPITTVQGIREANVTAFVETEGFENAFDQIEVVGTEQLELPPGSLPVVRVTYSYRQEIREAFSYGDMPHLCDGRLGSLVIPGSGDNQSSAIFTGDPENYHSGILDAVSGESPDYRFIFIKPNHDFLAWHNGEGKKLHGDYVFTWHLNRGGSYSASYLVDALAFTKWMQSCFQETAVLGLSQGGAATLQVGLQAQPTYAVVASGHTLLFRETQGAAPNQIVGVPGYFELFRYEVLVAKLRESPTMWLFTWGRTELAAYGREAREGPTYNALGELGNVVVSGHNGGRVFPVGKIREFLPR